MSNANPRIPPTRRVPRGSWDDRFVKGNPLPESRVGSGVVVSIDGDTCTVQIGDDRIDGVIWLGEYPPYLHDPVEVEARGEILVVPPDDSAQAGGKQNVVLSDDWYFIPAESPGWLEEGYTEGEGERAYNAAPSGAGHLWNTTVLDVSPGQSLALSVSLSSLIPQVASARFVVLWADDGADPQPTNGQVVEYSPTVNVAGSPVGLAASVNVPNTFTRPSGGTSVPGQARIGIRLAVA